MALADDQLPSASNEELKRAEIATFRTLNDDRITYSQRQQLTLRYLRLVLERSLRETERALGLRHPRS